MTNYDDSAQAFASCLRKELSRRGNCSSCPERISTLLYLVMREGFAVFNRPLFDAEFFVTDECLICSSCLNGNESVSDLQEGSRLSLPGRLIAASVAEQYGTLEDQQLSCLMRSEKCLQNPDRQKILTVTSQEIQEESKKLSVLVSLWNMDHGAFRAEFEEEFENGLA